MSINEALIGKGLRFPMEYTLQGGPNKSTYIDRINQSINIILDTPIGSRLMLPDFGSHLQDLRFDPLDGVLIEQIEYYIKEDLGKWEPRIRITQIQFQDTPEMRERSILFVTIKYMIINTTVEGSYVYPYQYGPRPITEPEVSYYGD